MDNGVHGNHGQLVRLLVVKMQRNIPLELVIVQRHYTVYQKRNTKETY